LLVDIICTLAFLERDPIILLLVLPAERTFKAVAVTIPVLDACTVLELLSSFTYSPEIQPVVLLYLILYHPFAISRIDILVL